MFESWGRLVYTRRRLVLGIAALVVIAAAVWGTRVFGALQSGGGFTAPLTYTIDLGKPNGSRITDLSYAGAPIDPAASFVIAINNYRASGGGNFPSTAGNPAIYNAQMEIRQLIIDWVTTNGTIDPSAFHTVDWSLTYNGQPLQITP